MSLVIKQRAARLRALADAANRINIMKIINNIRAQQVVVEAGITLVAARILCLFHITSDYPLAACNTVAIGNGKINGIVSATLWTYSEQTYRDNFDGTRNW